MTEQELTSAIRAAGEMKHEFSTFMSGIAKWFSEHPELRASSPPIVHSVKSRLKDIDHLRDKIQRKQHDDDPITAGNVFQRITDLAGVRVLHLHQSQFLPIHERIMHKVEVQRDWVLTERPKAYTWDPESDSFFRAAGLECSLKDSFYTSVHYTIRPRIDSPLCCEVQVRTLFEEIWGEVDHALNYPTATDVTSCREQLKVLAKLVGAGSRLVDSIFKAAEGAAPKEPV